MADKAINPLITSADGDPNSLSPIALAPVSHIPPKERPDSIATGLVRLSLERSLTVGREAMSGQIVLDHPSVSRRHAAFDVANECVVLRDLGGTKGTYVNGALLRGARSLVHGDRIDIGPFGFMFDGTGLTRVRRAGNVELLVRGISYHVSKQTYQRVIETRPPKRKHAYPSV
jgi:pSer/pThr/pTyr-binding forkhead associated (FHA) protein